MVAPSVNAPDMNLSSVRQALRYSWLGLALFLAAVIFGIQWDRRWHTTNPFEDFWSPPHIFIYVMFTATAGVMARMIVWPEIRAWFGPTISTPLRHLRVPGALLLTAGGLMIVGAGGVLDSVWHTAFGLDETGWSFPHSLLGLGMAVTLCGFIACRIALGRFLPVSWVFRAATGWMLLSAIVSALAGPMGNNNSAELVQGISRIPVLAADPDAQRMFRIYLEWNITRTNPIFVPLSAFAIGAGLAVTLGAYGRARWLLIAAIIATFLSLLGDRGAARYFGLEGSAAAWAPLPFIPAAVAVAGAHMLPRLHHGAWWAAGLLHSLYVVAIWDGSAALILPGILAMVAGAACGRRIASTMLEPNGRRLALLMAMAVGIPLLTGCLDLILRFVTP